MQIELIKKEIPQMVLVAQAVEIVDTETLTSATVMLSTLNKHNDAITTEKEKITRPLLDALAVERGRWKPVENQLGAAIEIIRGKMIVYQTNAIKKQNEERIKIADKLESGSIKTDTALSKLSNMETIDTRIKTDTGSISFSSVKCFEIVDFAKLPDEYKIANEKAIRETLKTKIQIEGIRYFNQNRPVNRR